MNWKWKLILLAAGAVPAFTGFPVNRFDTLVVPGIRLSWVAYALMVHVLVAIAAGWRVYRHTLTIAALVTVPVVFMGGIISYGIALATTGSLTAQATYSAHYLSLCITMLTVVPVALAMVLVLPFGQFEQVLLQRSLSGGSIGRSLLMGIRVFNHVAFSVIPGILEVIREEHLFKLPGSSGSSAARDGTSGAWGRIRALMRAMVHIGVDAICASVQYIPLWAAEIAQLADARDRKPSA
jgi:hypothetical protein